MQTGEQGSTSGDRGVREDGVAVVTGSEAEGLNGPLRGPVLHSSLPTSSPPP